MIRTLARVQDYDPIMLAKTLVGISESVPSFERIADENPYRIVGRVSVPEYRGFADFCTDHPALVADWEPKLFTGRAYVIDRNKVAEKIPPGKFLLQAYPDQARVLLGVLHEAAAKPLVSEVELCAMVTASKDDGRLRTLQDPWAIFRYYRSQFLRDGMFKFADIPRGEF